jgi:hypothetical protein
MKAMYFLAQARFTEPMLGTAPSDPEIYKSFIASKKAKADAKLSADEAKLMTDNIAKEEVALLPELAEKGITVFRRNSTGLILMDFMARGFLKEAATAMSGIWGVESKIDKWVHVLDRHIPITRNGVQLTKPDGIFERPLRAMTQQGPRVALAASEIIGSYNGTDRIEPIGEFQFHFIVLPLSTDPKRGKLSVEEILSWFDYGNLCGMGQWRSGSYGRFVAKITYLGLMDYSIDFETMLPVIKKLVN